MHNRRPSINQLPPLRELEPQNVPPPRPNRLRALVARLRKQPG
jgi:hypothetical protein